MRWLFNADLIKGRALDYGCGRGFDANYYGLDAYDPVWCPASIEGRYDTITCLYVLNVIDASAQKNVLQQLKELLADGGTAYVAVRRDLPKDGKPGRGCFQRYVELDVKKVRETSGYAIYAVGCDSVS
jgi:hypothetical protein